MKYAVIYQSRSGNTQILAQHIYNSLRDADKVICDLDFSDELPTADIYFVGFGIYNGNCSVEIMDCLERIETGKLALFVTCGYAPTEQYKAKLEGRLLVWLPEHAEYLGMFLCQGRVPEEEQPRLLAQTPQWEQEVSQMLEAGNSHPHEVDLQRLSGFIQKVCDQANTRIIPIL